MCNARELHSALQVAVQRYREAEQSVVTVFAEIFSSHAYREFGYAAITEYMESEFGFSDSKTRQFVMLARAMQAMPELASAVQSQELEWTKAVDVARSATPRSAAAWVEQAKSSTRSELRREIQRGCAKPLRQMSRASCAGSKCSSNPKMAAFAGKRRVWPRHSSSSTTVRAARRPT